MIMAQPSTTLPEILILTLVLVVLMLWGFSNAPKIAEPLQRALIEASRAGAAR
jgi:hypothetical protein